MSVQVIFGHFKRLANRDATSNRSWRISKQIWKPKPHLLIVTLTPFPLYVLVKKKYNSALKKYILMSPFNILWESEIAFFLSQLPTLYLLALFIHCLQQEPEVEVILSSSVGAHRKNSVTRKTFLKVNFAKVLFRIVSFLFVRAN